MNEITAKEAQILSMSDVDKNLEIAYNAIREAATKGHKSVALHNWWATEGYRGSSSWTKAVGILKSKGFIVDFHYEERQFVNMYTVVKW